MPALLSSSTSGQGLSRVLHHVISVFPTSPDGSDSLTPHPATCFRSMTSRPYSIASLRAALMSESPSAQSTSPSISVSEWKLDLFLLLLDVLHCEPSPSTARWRAAAALVALLPCLYRSAGISSPEMQPLPAAVAGTLPESCAVVAAAALPHPPHLPKLPVLTTDPGSKGVSSLAVGTPVSVPLPASAARSGAGAQRPSADGVIVGVVKTSDWVLVDTNPGKWPVRYSRWYPSAVVSRRGKVSSSFESELAAQDCRNVECIVLGTNVLCPPSRVSYSDPRVVCESSHVSIVFAPVLYLCQHCLSHFLDEASVRAHLCPMHAGDVGCVDPFGPTFPPGIEIFRRGDLSVVVVDGNCQPYAQQLCLLGSSFIESKTLLLDTAPFLFFLLLDKGHIAGYYSREKVPARVASHNLSCIAVFPPWRGRALGHLLIDVSHAVSRATLRPGTAERPFSRDGCRAYSKYWRWCILSTLLDVLKAARAARGAAPRQGGNDAALVRGAAEADLAAERANLETGEAVDASRPLQGAQKRARSTELSDANVSAMNTSTIRVAIRDLSLATGMRVGDVANALRSLDMLRWEQLAESSNRAGGRPPASDGAASGGRWVAVVSISEARVLELTAERSFTCLPPRVQPHELNPAAVHAAVFTPVQGTEFVASAPPTLPSCAAFLPPQPGGPCAGSVSELTATNLSLDAFVEAVSP